MVGDAVDIPRSGCELVRPFDDPSHKSDSAAARGTRTAVTTKKAAARTYIAGPPMSTKPVKR